MSKFTLSLVILFLLSGCSFKSEPNEWKYKSINAFSSYTQNFLSGRDVLAQSDLKRALSHAKQSAKFKQLSRIYLGECALNISVGIDDKCLKYKEVSNLVDDKTLQSYYEFITLSFTQKSIKNLDSKYEEFAKSILDKDYAKAKEEVFDMDQISSTLLSASLVKEEFSFDEISVLIDEASYYGYKKSVIFWLNVQKYKTNDDAKKKVIIKKLKIME